MADSVSVLYAGGGSDALGTVYTTLSSWYLAKYQTAGTHTVYVKANGTTGYVGDNLSSPGAGVYFRVLAYPGHEFKGIFNDSSPAYPIITYSASSYNGWVINGFTNFYVSGLAIKVAGGVVNWLSGIRLINCPNTVIDNCGFNVACSSAAGAQSVAGGVIGALDDSSTTSLTVRNCVFRSITCSIGSGGDGKEFVSAFGIYHRPSSMVSGSYLRAYNNVFQTISATDGSADALAAIGINAGNIGSFIAYNNYFATPACSGSNVNKSIAPIYLGGYWAAGVGTYTWTSGTGPTTSDIDYNGYQAASATYGTHNQVSVTASSEFTSLTSGSENFHLKDTAPKLKANGSVITSKTGHPTADIDGDAFPASSVNIGIDQFIVAAPPVNVTFSVSSPLLLNVGSKAATVATNTYHYVGSGGISFAGSATVGISASVSILAADGSGNYTTFYDWFAEHETPGSHVLLVKPGRYSGLILAPLAASDSSTHYTIKAFPGYEFDGTFPDYSDAPPYCPVFASMLGIQNEQNYIEVSGICFQQYSTTGSVIGCRIGDSANVIIEGCGFDLAFVNPASSYTGVVAYGVQLLNYDTNPAVSVTIRDCVFKRIEVAASSETTAHAYGIHTAELTSNNAANFINVYNCFFNRCASSGDSAYACQASIAGAARTFKAYNSFFATPVATSHSTVGSSAVSTTIDHNATDSATALGTNCTTSVALENEILDASLSGFDPHLLTRSVLKGAGVNIQAQPFAPATDLDGDAWDLWGASAIGVDVPTNHLHYVGSGAIGFGGVASTLQTIHYLGSGSITLGGYCNYLSNWYSYRGSGNLNLAGTAVRRFQLHSTGSGAIHFSGTAKERAILRYAGVGGIVISGSYNANQSAYGYIGTGGISFGGEAWRQYDLHAVGRGGISFGGSGVQRISGLRFVSSGRGLFAGQYEARATVTLPANSFHESASNLPIPVNLTLATTKAGVNFTALDGTQLPFDASCANGNLKAWVELPSVDGQAQEFYLYYGADQNTATQPWSNYTSVYHLDEQGRGISGEYKDAKGLLHATGGATRYFTPDLTTGKIANAQFFDGNAFIKTAAGDNVSTTDPISVSAWILCTDTGLQRTIFSHGLNSGANRCNFSLGISNGKLSGSVTSSHTITVISASRQNGSATKSAVMMPKEYSATGKTKLQKNIWYHVAMVWYPNDGISLYLNGTLDAHKAVSETALFPGNNQNQIGRRNQSYYFKGNIDEVRTASHAFTDNYLKAEIESAAVQVEMSDPEFGMKFGGTANVRVIPNA